LSLLFISCTSSSKKSHTEDVQQFQYEQNTQFSDIDNSPLTEEDFETFKSLEFFKIDKNFKIEADLELTPNSPVFEMQTTTDRAPLYRKYGIATFAINGVQYNLSIYQSQDLITSLEHINYLFLPFNDSTNGKTTYAGGRFIDLDISTIKNNKIIIDFNKSYNPYCAYNHKYSCPIPPQENILKIPILAGIKDYKKNLH